MCAVEPSLRSALVFVLGIVLISVQPTEAWYKQSTGPSYYSVGRASGLLSGIRRSPYVRRSGTESVLDSGESASSSSGSSGGSNAIPELSNRPTPVLKNMVNMAVCVKDISPNLQTCELLQDGSATFRCRADVLLSLDSLDCLVV